MPEEHCKTSSIPFSSIRTVTVGFGVAPNLLTLPLGTAGARGLMRRNAITAGGDFHPAPRTFVARGAGTTPRSVGRTQGICNFRFVRVGLSQTADYVQPSALTRSKALP